MERYFCFDIPSGYTSYTYNTLIFKATDYQTAEAIFPMMERDGIQPNVVTYNRLFSKNLSEKSAEGLLSWYLAQKNHPEEPIQAAIASYRKIGRTDNALRLALDYPHLAVARKLLREHAAEAFVYLNGVREQQPDNQNVDYALAIANLENGRELAALPFLKKAADTAKPGPRKTSIEEWICRIDGKERHVVGAHKG